MTNNPALHTDSKTQYTAQDFERIAKMFLDSKPADGGVLLRSAIINKCELAINNVKAFKDIDNRITNMKETLGVDELSRGEMLTAINGGKFPSTPEEMKMVEEMLPHFSGKSKAKKEGGTKNPIRWSRGPRAQQVKLSLGWKSLTKEQYKLIKEHLEKAETPLPFANDKQIQLAAKTLKLTEETEAK